jgi:hypothetical protein
MAVCAMLQYTASALAVYLQEDVVSVLFPCIDSQHWSLCAVDGQYSTCERRAQISYRSWAALNIPRYVA